MGRHPSLRNRALNARKGVKHYSAPESIIYWVRLSGRTGLTAFRLIRPGSAGKRPWRWRRQVTDGKSALVKAYQADFFLRRHSSAVISQISDGKRPET